jgi:hypothetical protein
LFFVQKTISIFYKLRTTSILDITLLETVGTPP